MSAEAVTKVAEEEHVDPASVSHEHDDDQVVTKGLDTAMPKSDDMDVENKQSGANATHTEPRTQVSAHEQDREEQASRRIKEAQRYHERNKGPKGSSRGGRGGYESRNRFDPTKQEKSDDPVAIRKQVKPPNRLDDSLTDSASSRSNSISRKAIF